MTGQLKKVWCFGKNSNTEREMTPFVGDNADCMRAEGVEGIARSIPGCAVFQEDFSFEWRELTVQFGPSDSCFVEIQSE